MSAPINLNRARKAKTRSDAKAEATENRVRFGRGKAEKNAAKAAVLKAERALDHAKRET
jgi:uncharacterized protein DUF4169